MIEQFLLLALFNKLGLQDRSPRPKKDDDSEDPGRIQVHVMSTFMLGT